jgi:hypothetical protein
MSVLVSGVRGEGNMGACSHVGDECLARFRQLQVRAAIEAMTGGFR